MDAPVDECPKGGRGGGRNPDNCYYGGAGETLGGRRDLNRRCGLIVVGAGECELGVFGYTASSLEHSMSAQRSLTYEEDDDDVMFGKVVLSSCVKHMVKSCAGTNTKARTCW